MHPFEPNWIPQCVICWSSSALHLDLELHGALLHRPFIHLNPYIEVITQTQGGCISLQVSRLTAYWLQRPFENHAVLNRFPSWNDITNGRLRFWRLLMCNPSALWIHIEEMSRSIIYNCTGLVNAIFPYFRRTGGWKNNVHEAVCVHNLSSPMP